METPIARAPAQSIVVNGEAAMTAAETLSGLLAELGLADARVATAVNGAFVAARDRASVRLAAGDRIEIVSPRQGG